MKYYFNLILNYIVSGSRYNKANIVSGHLPYWGLTALSVYILAPTFTKLLFGSDEMFSSASKRIDKNTTGLINNRNDCFANSSVQALAALPKLTQYLNELLGSVSLIANMLDNEHNDADRGEGDGLHDALVDGHVSNPVDSWERDLLTPKVELNRNPIENGVSIDQGLVTPKAEPKENPMENLSSLDGVVEEQIMPRTKSTTTLSTLLNGSKLSERNYALSTAGVSEEQEFNGTEETKVTKAQIPEMLMHLGLAKILAQLQETVTSSRNISVWPLLRILEIIFNAKISSGQNDAHELTQIILETLQKENTKLDEFAKKHKLAVQIPKVPFQGNVAGHLVCLVCTKSSKVNVHPFNIFPLQVPQAFSAKLSDMVADNQTETIEGYSCLVCKVKAILANEEGRGYKDCLQEELNILRTLKKAVSDLLINDDISEELSSYIDSYNKNGVVAKDIKSTIVKKTAVVDSADILVLHLSRSMFNGMTYSRNSCGVAFDEILECVEQVIENNRCVGIKTVRYKLKAMVKHTGSHSQGHYECYRRKPDFVKDTVSKQVINRSPLINLSLLDTQNTNVSDSFKNQENTFVSNGSTEGFNQQIQNSLSNFTLNADALPISVKTNGSSDDDYTISAGGDSNKPSRKPSALKRITGFLSRRSSVSNAADDSNNEAIVPSSVDLSRSTNNSFDRSRSSSIVGDEVPRSRAGSVSTSNTGRVRGSSISSVDSQSSYMNSSDANIGSTSASELENNTTGGKRILKKIKSVSKYPFWHISDTTVKEAKANEVLAEMRYVYMLYYERID
ncbi:hypothetical protein HG535_0A05610 [Zygotorulaspora mrakii]|uniref:USP domain-containing protein n=1 Tax=Zygotorulaspora mrakii TaxID=42260 RepID=A0A7H9AW48_ZYGMR|nr:uncharacterized protein HG535_0A05610 [Zygotorulaspora mrakii]QLG70620.1 hypothetical protein HG535_0A05610 [Zygotorulaspora mrakii]